MTKQLLLILMLGSSSLLAQVGGENVYRFLLLPNSARLTALGGMNISAQDPTAAAAIFNPALLDESSHQALSFNHQFYYAGTQHGFFNYAHHLPKNQVTLHTGFQYMRYGDFILTDEFDQQLGTFNAGEFAWTVGASKTIYDRLRAGINIKVINSTMETYNAFAMAGDLALQYFVPEKKFSAALVINNIGGTFKQYREGNSETMPYDVRIGMTKRLAKAPIQFSVTAHHLHRWNLLYDNPESEEKNFLINDLPEEENRFTQQIDNFFRHLVFGAELFIGKKEQFRIRLGYNHFRRRELTVLGFRSLAGMSGGVGFKLNRFRIDYGFGTYHLAGSAHHFSISTNLQEFNKDIKLP